MGKPFKKGYDPRRNLGGRPVGFAGLARKVREATGDGQELLDIALEIARDKTAKHRDRMSALQFLADRGFGKPLQPIELHAAISDGRSLPAYNFEALSLEQRAQLLELLEQARPPKLIDAESSETPRPGDGHSQGKGKEAK